MSVYILPRYVRLCYAIYAKEILNINMELTKRKRKVKVEVSSANLDVILPEMNRMDNRLKVPSDDIQISFALAQHFETRGSMGWKIGAL